MTAAASRLLIAFAGLLCGCREQPVTETPKPEAQWWSVPNLKVILPVEAPQPAVKKALVAEVHRTDGSVIYIRQGGDGRWHHVRVAGDDQ